MTHILRINEYYDKERWSQAEGEYVPFDDEDENENDPLLSEIAEYLEANLPVFGKQDLVWSDEFGLNETCFEDAEGNIGFVFNNENDAKKFLADQNSQELKDKYFEDPKSNFYKDLKKCGCSDDVASSIVNSNNRDEIALRLIGCKRFGPEFFLSSITGKSYVLPSGKVLYY